MARSFSLRLVLLLALVVLTACGTGATPTLPISTSLPTPAASQPPATDTPVPTATTVPSPAPTATPVSHLIAFMSRESGNGEIYLVSQGVQTPVNITNHPAEDWGPMWSPDGQSLAFMSNRDGIPHIYVMKVDGTDVRRLTDSADSESQPAWSPDGAKIAYLVEYPQFDDIIMADVSTGQRTNLTQTPLVLKNSLNWLPDGKGIAFTQSGDAAGIYTIDLDHSDPKRVSKMGKDRQGMLSGAWSPDGTRLAYLCSSPEAKEWNICLIEVKGGNSSQLTSKQGNHACLRWLEDNRLVFCSNRDGQIAFFSMQPDGTQVKRLANVGDTYSADYAPHSGVLPIAVATPYQGAYSPPTPEPQFTPGPWIEPTPTVVVETGDGYAHRAYVFYNSGDCASALPDATRAIELKGGLVFAYYVRIHCALAAGQAKQALADLNAMIELEPEHPDWYDLRSGAYQQLGNIEAALTDGIKAAELRSDVSSLISLYQSRASFYEQARKNDLALADYAKMIELQPDNVQAYTLRSRLYMLAQQNELAIADFTRLIELQPNVPEHYTSRAVLLYSTGQRDLAIKDLEHALTMNLDAKTRALVEQMLKDFKK
jgi:Tol biopolymer transport system component/Flp pilus assembly protein TadD